MGYDVNNYDYILFRFKLNVDRVVLTIGVTIIQDVAPTMTFCNPVNTIFQTLPEDNLLNLNPHNCSNISCGDVTIDPVILHPWVIPWSDVEATASEESPPYLTIGEQFNMTLRACMPESRTGIELFVTLPSIESEPVVTLDDAYVTFLGSELRNTIIFEGDGKK